VETPVPEEGAPILVLGRKWFDLMTSGEKTLEIRHQPLAPGRRLLGEKGHLWGTVELGVPTQIASEEQWEALRPRHRWPAEQVALPYLRTWALPVVALELWPSELRYVRFAGAEGTAKYHTVPDGWDPDVVVRKKAFEDYLRTSEVPVAPAVHAGKGRGARKKPAATSGAARKRPAATMEVGDAADSVRPVATKRARRDAPRQPDINVPVPPDGRCLSYCWLAARDTRAWMRGRNAVGFVSNADRESQEREEAKAFLEKVIGAVENDGLQQQAARLRLAGSAGYPGDEELHFYAKVLGGRIELDDPVVFLRARNLVAADEGVDEDVLKIYASSVRGRVALSAPTMSGGPPSPVIEFGDADAPLLYRVAFQMITGPDGHESPHWILACSYMARAVQPPRKPLAKFYDAEAGASEGSADESDGSQGDDVNKLGNVIGGSKQLFVEVPRVDFWGRAIYLFNYFH